MAAPPAPKKTEWFWHGVAIGVMVLMVVLVAYGF